MGGHALLQGIFPTQGLKPGGSPALQAYSLPLSHTGSDCLQLHVPELHILGLHLLLPHRADPLTSLSEGTAGLQVFVSGQPPRRGGWMFLEMSVHALIPSGALGVH